MRKANKKLASAIVLGLMLAVPVGASAAEVTDPINSSTGKYESSENVHIVNKGNKGNDESTRIVEETRDSKSPNDPDKNYDAYITYGIYGKKIMLYYQGKQ